MSLDQKLHIVGIGSSAGGLEALMPLVANLQPELPYAYVVLQHSSPSHRSMMAEILGRETSLPVMALADDTEPQAGCIYVVPAQYNAILRQGRLYLVTPATPAMPMPSINQFLISLAAERRESAIGIVLSGTGADGTAGLSSIRAVGGTTLVQSPESAKYDGMPRSAIEAGAADVILTPEDMPAHLRQLCAAALDDAADFPPGALQRLLELLHQSLGTDFSGYKANTMARRLRRRLKATETDDIDAYLALVARKPEELTLLAQDLLVSVTAFFRDEAAFEALRVLLQEVVARKAPEADIRVWVAGCATGEEAYSIAILLKEAMQHQGVTHGVQIFATDLDEEALGVARRGVYPASSLAGMDPELIERHFSVMHQSYEVAKHLRDMVVFARHNLVSDPPFLRLDLVSCRNVLIYFDTRLQAQVLSSFHFGLLSDGHLFLGRSESIAQAESLFTPVERNERLFLKAAVVAAKTTRTIPARVHRLPVSKADHRVQSLLNGLVEHLQATALLCDVDGNMQHSAGQVDDFLNVPTGAARLYVADLIVPELRGEVLTLLHRFQKSRRPQHSRIRRVGEQRVRLFLQPVKEGGGGSVVLLILPVIGPMLDTETDPPVVTLDRQLEDELLSTREHLHTLLEEMATSNEEMQALHEESQAANEELQAANEEMEAANEELQATNEELVSLNEEFNVKTNDLARLAQEYAHLNDSLPFLVLVFSRQGLLQRFNARAAQRFGLSPASLQQHVRELDDTPAMQAIANLVQRVALQGGAAEEVLAEGDHIFRISVNHGLEAVAEVSVLIVSLVDITDISLTQRRLKESQARLSAVTDATAIIFALKSVSGVYLYVNARFLEFFRLRVEDVLGRTDFELFPSSLATDLWGTDLEALRLAGSREREHPVADGEGMRHLRATHHVLLDEAGRPESLIFEAEDITFRKQAEQQLRIVARIFEQSSEAIVICDAQGAIQTCNAAFTVITGYSMVELTGQPLLRLIGESTLDSPQALWQQLLDQGHWQGEVSNQRKDGDRYPAWLTINRVTDALGRTEHFVAVFSDITMLKESQRRVEYLAKHDDLSGLPNRIFLVQRLRQMLAARQDSGEQVVVLFIDIDNFKVVNDSFGHTVGDVLLRLMAHRLQAVVGLDTLLGRFGGDEFLVVLPDADLETASALAHRIVEDCALPFHDDTHTLFATVSVGMACFPGDGMDVEELLKAADNAMYHAKAEGRNRLECFRPELRTRMVRRVALERGLRESLAQGGFRLVYQPKFDLREPHTPVGAEVLLRWEHPSLGLVGPAEFIPVAERSGLIVEIDRLVLHMLLTQLARWRSQGLMPPPVAMNVSPYSIREPGFSEALLAEIEAQGLPQQLVQIEITEGALLENSRSVVNNLNTLSQAGVAISVDDFGTGYSSLSYLKRLPLTELKIDRSFIEGLGHDKENEAITRAILGLAQALDLRTVAEGVETEQQAIWLAQAGCHHAQGYWLARPLESADFEACIAH